MLFWIKSKILDFQWWKARHRVFAWPSYGKWVEEMHQDKSQFVPYTDKPYERKNGDPKIFAYYLTQFHAIPENDDAHGKGFTEWTNVASAAPQFVGHYQPKIPYDLGFYNLLMPGVMERQAELAKTYGVYGFCFYYYWFSGRKVLEKPLEYWFEHKEIDLHYHFCWANENWSKLWDGGNRELILEQEIKEGDAERFFADMLPHFKDERYEKIDNKPILMIYRPSMFPNDVLTKFVDTIQDLAKKNGFDGIYLTYSSFQDADVALMKEIGFEGMVEFPPHGLNIKSNKKEDRLIPKTTFTIHDMDEFIRDKAYLTRVEGKIYRCCFPQWDNTPRKAWSGGWCYRLTGEGFKTWLKDIIRWTKDNHPKNEQYVYINAWNEWAEGAILEPTLRYGYKYLDIVKNAIIETR